MVANAFRVEMLDLYPNIDEMIAITYQALLYGVEEERGNNVNAHWQALPVT